MELRINRVRINRSRPVVFSMGTVTPSIMSEDGVEEHKILICYIFANFSQNMENKINKKIYWFFSLLLFRYVSIKDFLSDVLFTDA